MEAVDAIIAAVIHNRPITKMTYVAIVAIRNLDDRPWVDVIIHGDAITPAAKTYRSPRGRLKGRVNDKTIESRTAQTLVTTSG
ncbi:hypothetical protein RRF57_001028 [Xylaria bambusicola]|uniref:Uncharacterized protein n=1 Tax=Xylaria bambusicola TaxID=326684 RepID=A0AAN7Z195_9PEZI